MNNGISIILPTYNEGTFIARVLDRILAIAETSNIETEIIVVDNMSTDDTVSIVSRYPVTLLTSTKKGSPSTSRNLGASKAKFDILYFVDGDCLIHENALTVLCNHFQTIEFGAYGGPVLSPEDGNWVERTWAPTALKPYRRSNAVLPGANFAVSAKLFKLINGFDESLVSAEDDELSTRIKAKGYDVISDSEIAVIHLGYPKTLLGIFQKQIWHGSSQLKAHGLFGDKIVTLTLLWIIAITLLPISLLFSPLLTLPFLSFTLIAPLLIALKRTQSYPNRSIGLIAKTYLICCSFLAGRSVGLITEVFNYEK